MIKKLDKLIIKAFVGPFIATFFITCFVLIMQILWKYIDDLVGKGLDFWVVAHFLWYASASLVALAFPIALLISSIMTFGNLGESFELVAIKSSGISLLRFMRPLMFIAIILCVVSFFFANNVIPYANLKFVTLYRDIFYKKPAFDLKEGVFFTHIPNYAIKVGKKDRDGKTIHKILIYEQTNRLQDNTIVAEKGEMGVSKDQRFLEFNLYNGTRYQERGNPGDSSTEYIRLNFKTYKKLFDLSSLQQQNSSDSAFKSGYKMLSARQLQQNLRTIRHLEDSLKESQKKQVSEMFYYPALTKDEWKQFQKKKTLGFSIPDSLQTVVWQKTYSRISTLKGMLLFNQHTLKEQQQELKQNKTEWHRKYAMSLSCLVLFFIGAPLGSIIRKGGLGMPLLVSIFFFLIFHLLNMFGDKFVREDIMAPAAGMWLSVIVLTPIGAFLTYKAMHDSQLFNKEFYYRTFTVIRNFVMKKRDF